MKTLKLILFLGFLFISMPACDKMQNPVPYVYVNFRIELNDPSYFKLQATGGSANVLGGVGGIIIYRKSMDEFYAFDRACTYDPDKGIVSIDKTGLWAVCDVCKSEFTMLIEGSIKKGPAHVPLKMYTTSFNINTNVLSVYN